MLYSPEKQMPSRTPALHLQNRQYPIKSNAVMIAIPHGILDNRSMISIPTATKNQRKSRSPVSKIHHTHRPSYCKYMTDISK